jgi:hypothetical protein
MMSVESVTVMSPVYAGLNPAGDYCSRCRNTETVRLDEAGAWVTRGHWSVG